MLGVSLMQTENKRLEALTEQIETYFDVRDPYIVPTFEPAVEEHVVDMFTVEGVHAKRARLNRWLDDLIYTAVIGDSQIASLLRPGDVFLMTLICRQGKWRVWHMSPPYEQIENDWDEEE